MDTVVSSADNTDLNTSTASDLISSPILRNAGVYKPTAELIIVINSLRSNHKEYFHSRRCLDICRITGILPVLVDVNKESIITTPNINNAYMQRLKDSEVVKYCNERVYAPQCIINGLNMGGYDDFQALVDMKALKQILEETCCGNCLRPLGISVVENVPKAPCECAAKEQRIFTIEEYDSIRSSFQLNALT